MYQAMAAMSRCLRLLKKKAHEDKAALVQSRLARHQMWAVDPKVKFREFHVQKLQVVKMNQARSRWNAEQTLQGAAAAAAVAAADFLVAQDQDEWGDRRVPRVEWKRSAPRGSQ
jgi:hypothetical protein